MIKTSEGCWKILISDGRPFLLLLVGWPRQMLLEMGLCCSSSSWCLYFHLAKILSLGCLVETSISAIDTNQHETWQEDIRSHALAIASISLSGIADAVLVIAVIPLFYAAKHTHGLTLKTRIWKLLEDIDSIRVSYARPCCSAATRTDL
ncbi:hypothetical protein BJX99DRAFT_70 [Aspergillus californicus]